MQTKTEGLSWAEVIKAYANGEVIEDQWFRRFWMDKTNSLPMVQHAGSPALLQESTPLEPFSVPFKVVQPEPKRLTFEEALRCEKVDIQYPEETNLNKQRFIKGHWWDISALSQFDLAERRGWPIVEVEGE